MRFPLHVMCVHQARHDTNKQIMRMLLMLSRSHSMPKIFWKKSIESTSSAYHIWNTSSCFVSGLPVMAYVTWVECSNYCNYAGSLKCKCHHEEKKKSRIFTWRMASLINSLSKKLIKTLSLLRRSWLGFK